MLIYLALQQVTYMLFIAPLTQAQDPSPSPCTKDHLFDFETSNEKSCFQSAPSDTLTLSTDQKTVKKGQKSLKWQAVNASTLKLKPASTFTIPNNWLLRGGIKVWLYKEELSPGKTLAVRFKHVITLIGSFQVNLNFNGWRGIWVKFNECKSQQWTGLTVKEVEFALSDADTIYFDLLEFKSSVGKQTRDKVVPPISPFGLELYDASNTWQRTYYWSQQSIPTPPSTIDERKKESLELIEKRLKNWYCDETKTTPSFTDGSNLKRRWNSLLRSIKNAHSQYEQLTLDDESKVVGPPLFCRDCRGSNEQKFGFIMEKILLPLALEYHLRSRTNEIADTADTQLDNLNSADQDTKTNAYKAIAGENTNMQNLFRSYLPTSTPLNADQVKAAINTLNLDRLNKINNLLDYVKQQGFADGSGLGSLDHEMNKDGAGFMHTLFLLSDSLNSSSNKSRLLDLISTAKWYNDFTP